TFASLRGVAITPDGTSLIAVGESGAIVRSSDGGLSWRAASSSSTHTLDSIDFSQLPATAWIAGEDGTILRTDDGGEHFDSLPSPTHADLRAVVEM
ncbi:MAG: YCF48-related protein, partial [Polyangiaceae bacterium]